MSDQKLLIVPRGLTGAGMPETMALDVSMIYRAEARLLEVSRTTPANWLVLASDFNLGYAKAVKYKALLRSELGLANKAADMLKRDMTINMLVPFLKETGLRDSLDTREALYLSSEAYVRAMDRIGALEAAVELLDAKAKAFVNAYQTVKKIADEKERTWFRGDAHNHEEGEDVT